MGESKFTSFGASGYLKSSQLGQKAIDDLLLQVHGDMRRFEELRTLLLRMAHRHPDQQTTLYEDIAEKTNYFNDETDSWSTVTRSWAGDWNNDWTAAQDYDELYAWYVG